MLVSDQSLPYPLPQPKGGASRSRQRSAHLALHKEEKRDLLNLRQIEVTHDPQQATVWSYMRHQGRPAFNMGLLQDLDAWHDGVAALHQARPDEVRYLVLGSRFPNVFCLGGDLDYFTDRIRARDHDALLRYGRASIRVMHRSLTSLSLPIVTIGLAQGDALGGGFESLLSFNVVVAEKGVRFGLPEIVFGLFPGMGAHAILMRRLGGAEAQRMILSGGIFTAEELYRLGLVHVLAEPGKGEEAVREYIAQNARRHRGHCAVYAAQRVIENITLEEMDAIVEIWVRTALELREQDLKMMQRLVAAQNRLLGLPNAR